MVDLDEIRQHNDRMASNKLVDRVCVFAGGTGGIGLRTLQVVASLLCKSKIYILGRSASRFETQLKRLEKIGPTNEFIFIQAEFALLGSVDGASATIISSETRVDLLYMSPGSLPFNGPQFTEEGLDICCALSYYSRMRLVKNLFPLLQHSKAARVLNVLNGGKEANMVEDDLQLARSWSVMAVVNNNTTMTTLALDHMAQTADNVSLLHAYPGWVRTDIFRELSAPKGAGVTQRAISAFLQCVAWICLSLGGISAEDCGERQAYQLLSDRYGTGVHVVGDNSEDAPVTGALRRYRADGWASKVWDCTEDVFEQVLAGRLGQRSTQPGKSSMEGVAAALKVVAQAIGVSK